MNGGKDRVEAIFQAAMELNLPKEREAYLLRECGEDTELRHEVEELLRAAVEAEDVFEGRPQQPALEQAGSRIGRYHLLQKIGEGGCGVVYMAEQETPVRRKVALKVVKLGMDTRQVIARFEAERQALALMDHPNIAKVLDAGATVTGRPYFVMELVRGRKITQYCDEQRFSTVQRLELFIQVCQAVQHAHQKGIIHRDLKPSNILVTERDGVPVPKVIDFGIAKATGNLQLTDKTLFTAFEQFIGTPAYMSPEQARSGELEIDTRSDIYSLGVLLYELLTGQPPFEATELKRLAIDEVLKTVREKDPPLPSHRLTTMTLAQRTAVARSRQVEPSVLSKLLRGDLDWIVMKCLEKDRLRRYDTAEFLARDLDRYLKHQPVSAAAPSVHYRVRKFLRRHRRDLVQLTAGALVITLLVGFGLMISSARSPRSTFLVRVQDPEKRPIRGVSCQFIVAGFPTDKNGVPGQPKEEVIVTTDQQGVATLRNPALATAKRVNLYVVSTQYCGLTRFLGPEDLTKGQLSVVLFRRLCVSLTYVFNPNGDLSLVGSNTIRGKVTLYPMENGSYRPPARAFFSFSQNQIVGSSAVLDLGIVVDQKGAVIYFGDSNGRFDHCTDLGQVPFDRLEHVNTEKLVRERSDTPILKGHTYIFESNIYPPDQWTRYTGSNLCYAKISIDSIDAVDKNYDPVKWEPSAVLGQGDFPPPHFSRAIVRNATHGVVVGLDIVVGSNGVPSDVFLYQSSEYPELDRDTIDWVKRHFRWPLGRTRYFEWNFAFNLQMHAGMVKMRDAMVWMSAFRRYAQDHQNLFPTNFDQLAIYLDQALEKDLDSGDVQAEKREFIQSTNRFEITYQGSLNEITNLAPETIALREREPWRATPNGGWSRTYGFVDGHVEIHTLHDGNFGPWEAQHLQKSPGP
jgi:serine/threonine protein kinase